MPNAVILKGVEIINLDVIFIFISYICVNCVYTVLTGTHGLCFLWE